MAQPTTAEPTSPPTPDRAPPTTKTLRVEDLTIDHVVQRETDDAWVSKKLREEGFLPEAMGVLSVNERLDGRYHVMDGQHRRALAIQAGHPDFEVKCDVHHGLSMAEEAAMFRHLNDRRSVQPLAKFRVRVVEGDPAAVEINELLFKHGWKVAQQKHAGCFAAVAAIEKIYTGDKIRHGPCPEIVDTMLTIIHQAWGYDCDGVRAEIISGLGRLLLVYYNSQIDLVKLTRELTALENGPLGLLGQARGLRALRGGSIGDSVAERIIALHNARKKNRLPDWRSAS